MYGQRNRLDLYGEECSAGQALNRTRQSDQQTKDRLWLYDLIRRRRDRDPWPWATMGPSAVAVDLVVWRVGVLC